MTNPPNHVGRRMVKINALSQSILIEAMLDGDMSCQELAEHSGLNYVTVLQYCRQLYLSKAAFICGWRRNDRNIDCIRLYKIGRGKDAKRAPPISAQQRTAEWRKRKQREQSDALLRGAV